MTHSVAIHALMVSWYPRRRSSNPIGDVMMDLGHYMIMIELEFNFVLNNGVICDGIEVHGKHLV